MIKAVQTLQKRVIKQEKKKWSDDLLSLFLYTALPVLGLLFVTVAMAQAMSVSLGDLDSDFADLIGIVGSMSAPMILCLAAVPLGIKMRTEKKTLRDLALAPRKVSAISLTICIPLTIVMFVYRREVLGGMTIVFASSWVLHYAFVAIAEEVYVRSILFDECKKVFTNAGSVLMTSLIFSFFMHSEGDLILNLVLRLPLGLILGFVRSKTGEIYTSIALHFMYNTTIMLALT